MEKEPDGRSNDTPRRPHQSEPLIRIATVLRIVASVLNIAFVIEHW